jgi:hypothetical protein
MKKRSYLCTLLLSAALDGVVQQSHAFSPSINGAALARKEFSRSPSLVSLNQHILNQAERDHFDKEIKARFHDFHEDDLLGAVENPKKDEDGRHERDYFRQSTRLEAWDSYVLVSVLCTSISYGTLSSFTVSPDHQGIFFYETVLEAVIHFAAGLSVLTGLYSTMVFSLSILYGKTALGMQRDVQFDKFMQNTGSVRMAGFRSFSATLGLFGLLVVLVLMEDLPLVHGFPVGTLLFGALAFGVKDWKFLVDHASQIFVEEE